MSAVVAKPAGREPGTGVLASTAPRLRLPRPLVRLPRLALVCALIAVVNGAVWAFIVPPLQIPDEQAHASYVEVIAQTGKLPNGHVPASRAAIGSLSTGYNDLLEGVPFSVEGPPTWSPQRDAELRQRLGALHDQVGTGVNQAANNPPMYYALAAIPARVFAGTGLLGQFLVIRLLSALIAGITAMLVFLFLRELLPGTPWVWLVGALVAELHPLVGFLSGGITPDNLLFMWSAALMLCIARAFHRGLTTRRAVALGLVAVCGVLTKGTMYGLLPGAAFGGLVCVGRLRRQGRLRAGLVAAGAGVVSFVAPFALWLWANTHIFGRVASTTSNGVTSSNTPGTTIGHWAEYVWQFFLPRLPFMTNQFTQYPHWGAWEVYWRGFVGRFGWFQYNFPDSVNIPVAILFVGLVALAVHALTPRRRMRGRWLEFATYVIMAVSVVLIVNTLGYLATAHSRHNFEQTRYLLPLLPLYAGLVAVAVKGGGRRWGPALGGLLVALAIAHTVSAELLTLVRYYA